MMKQPHNFWKDIAFMLMFFIAALLVALLIGVNKLPPPGPDIRVQKDTMELKRADSIVGMQLIFRH